MFAYCRNNPVSRKDVSGTEDVTVFLDDGSDGDIDCSPLDLDDFGSSSYSFAYAYNSIDAGYRYHIDLTKAANSSLVNGGVYNEGYTAYGTYSNPNSATNQSQRFSPDQQAVLDLAKECKSGIQLGEAEILVGWANEYGISNHAPMTHPDRSGIWGYTLHIKIKNYHIPVYFQED